ncbi:MAG: hypothetical protein ALECFALPRED_002045 [Alectoria fallacina]|uniref:Uncharacterized protein n=1 Tax=Alectoria fallacina TaxID=1903189 RepID=A0A8H3FCM3_9LECA|nr:MAG: hypothetical protein ALECFALPRED_002045 [Alectoria fallacina]
MEILAVHSTVLYRQARSLNEPVPTRMYAPTFYYNDPLPQPPPVCIYPVQQQYNPVTYYPLQPYATVEVGLPVAVVPHAPTPQYYQQVQTHHTTQQWEYQPVDFAPTIPNPQLPHHGDKRCEKHHHRHHHHTEALSVFNRHTHPQSHNPSHPSNATKARRGSVRQSGHLHQEARFERNRESHSASLQHSVEQQSRRFSSGSSSELSSTEPKPRGECEKVVVKTPRKVYCESVQSD